MARSKGEKYFFAMLNPENTDLYTIRKEESIRENRAIEKIYIIDLKRRRNWNGQETADNIYEGYL